MNNKVKVLVASVVVLLLAIGVGYSVLNKGKNSPAQTKKITKVGVIAPLTGGLAEYGLAFKNGITLATEKSGNKNVEYVFEDSQYDSGKAVAAYYKLKNIDKIDVLVNWGGVPTDAIAPLLKDQKMPFLAGSTLGRVTQSSPYTVRIMDTPDDFAISMWTYLRAHNQKNIAIVKTEMLYFKSVLDALDKNKNADESITVIDNYKTADETDFRTSILKIKNVSKQYDAVGVLLATGQIGQFYKQAGELGLTVPTFGTDFFENQSDIDTAGKNINGAVFANYNTTDSFSAEYKARFGNLSQLGYAGNGFDVANMLNGADLTNSDTIINSIKATKNYNGVLGSYNYVETSDDRYLRSPVKVKIIQDGLVSAVK
ncbi:MAG: ABC transporter substrate-binding protein [bacterium]